MTDFLDPLLDNTTKGYPHHAPPLRRSQVAAQGWNVLAGDLPLPVAVVKREALRHNVGWMQRHVERAGLSLAPHGKTTMSPQLFRTQLDAGAWGLTVANVSQARIAIAAGVRRCLIANQVAAANDLAAIAAMKHADRELAVWFLVDSAAQLALIEESRPAEPFDVLLEIGVPGGRTGCRTTEDAIALAAALHASAAVRLAGVECYEGLGAKADDAADRAYAAPLAARVAEVARHCDRAAWFDTDEVILSAGGSAIYDLVEPVLRTPLARPVRGVLRSGCYVTHDHGQYKRMAALVNRRLGCSDAQGLQPALEVWALVQSVPEPGLAIVNAGKRDLSHDLDLPLPVAHSRAGTRRVEPVPPGWRIVQLNDQHAYLRLPDGATPPAVGDRVALGISHPCTTFDKWRWMPIVDDDYRVVDALTTMF